ncbi:hypothetical protein [Staphylococcus epidermidis]|uniref:hypothetical protein n=1 Tax=Staphylococcus epidermidis TaxID=1282 RepID=UPI0011A6AF43|nr:hypothetical protein [Staphylococcus epidermidis]MBM0811438.1 hypothetical protein [Staphylococcus epidermidis]MCG1164977.1 hypothetical protein [Staphylococcus epidermidis]MCG1589711.1 hypothetical protein [Staphylococcus epidermidis]MCG2085452.1 hypothetical protein [Staphylococcus epidermidis]MCG2103346.1 hypothetical protein [Staphylococcus epidermidis]
MYNYQKLFRLSAGFILLLLVVYLLILFYLHTQDKNEPSLYIGIILSLFFGQPMKSMYELLFDHFVNFEEDTPKDFIRLKRSMKYLIDMISIVLMMCVLLLFSYNHIIAIAIMVFVIGFYLLHYWSHKI